MRRLHALLLMVCICSLAFAYDDPGYYFTNYNVDMVVTPKGYKITEHIDAEFTEESHGIYRMIPIYPWVKRDVSEKQDGSKTKMMHYKASIDDVEVSEAWEEMDDVDDSLYGMRIGSIEKMLYGPHSYTISYTFTPYDDRVEQSDLFFYSVLGSGWDCKIDRFSFHIHFDKPLTDEELGKLQLFAGNEGNSIDYKSHVITSATNTDITGELKRINPRNAITVFVPLREGYFEKGLHPSLDIILSWIFVALSIVLMLYVLVKELKPKEQVTKIISFEPPKGFSSADIGTIIDTQVNERDIMSLIPWFAEKGYLTIDNSGKRPTLHKVRPLPENAPKYQKKLFDAMFPSETTKFDTTSTTKKFGDAWLECKKELEKNFEKKLNDFDGKSAFYLFLAILAVSFANCFAVNSSYGWLIGGATSVFFCAVAFFQLVLSTDEGPSSTAILFAILDFIAYGIIGYILYLYFHESADPSYIPVNVIYGINIALGIVCFLASQLGFMTEYRRKHLGQILGLHEFISTAEKSQLEHLQAEDEKYFYHILPYAVAFGLASNWAKKFEGINVKPVDWYKGAPTTSFTHGIANFSTKSPMTESIKSAVSSAKAAAERSSSGSSYSSSSSYSSGGGGYSGGGFGGGGGGRW